MITNREVPDLSVVLPCLNEAESVGACVTEALTAMAAAGLNGEVVVADNGSTDGSAALALASGARVVDARVPGYGAAIQAGIAASKGRVIVMGDADCTYDFGKIPDLAGPVLDGHSDLVLGARLDAANRHSMPLLHRWVGTPAITFLVRRACGGLPVTDSQSGYRAFRKDLFDRAEVTSTGMEFASEMLLKAKRRGWRVSEIQAGYRPRVGESKLNTFSDGWRHLRLLVELAPQIALFWPGVLTFALGLFLSGWLVVSNAQLSVGSLQWQPQFFAAACTVIGAQAAIFGALLSQRSLLVSRDVADSYSFATSPLMRRRYVTGGLCSISAGLVIDLALAISNLGQSAPGRASALASLAASALILGVTSVGLGLVLHVLIPEAVARRRAIPQGPEFNLSLVPASVAVPNTIPFGDEVAVHQPVLLRSRTRGAE